jgi:hypothetical protein
MDRHRREPPISSECFPTQPPFSYFDFVENRYDGNDSIRRLFSLARSFDDYITLIVEIIEPAGIIAYLEADLQYITIKLLTSTLKQAKPKELVIQSRVGVRNF